MPQQNKHGRVSNVGRVASLFFSKNVQNKSTIKSFQVILPPLSRLLQSGLQEKSHQLKDILNKVLNIIITIKYLPLVCHEAPISSNFGWGSDVFGWPFFLLPAVLLLVKAATGINSNQLCCEDRRTTQCRSDLLSPPRRKKIG